MAEESVSGVRSSRRWSYIIGFLVVGYPLSIGPALWLIEKQILPEELFVMYEPILWLTYQSHWVRAIVWTYVSFFVPIGY